MIAVTPAAVEVVRVEPAVDAAQHHDLGRRLGDVHLELEEESIELRLGEWVGALVLHGVLGGHDEKAIAERAALAVGGDLALLHRLEERRLGLGRRAVDLVGEQRVGEDRALAELEACPSPGGRRWSRRCRTAAGRG